MYDLSAHSLMAAPGAKGFFRPGDEDAADLGVGVERLDRAEELVPERSVERIERLRPVEAHDADAPPPFDDDGFGRHGRPRLRFSRHAVTAPRARKARPAPGAAAARRRPDTLELHHSL